MSKYPIKVVYLITELHPGGAERILQTLVTGLNKKLFQTHVICLRGKGKIGQEIEAAGISVDYVGWKKKWQFFLFFRLIRLIAQQRPDILHCHLFHTNILGRCARLFTNIPVVLSTVHTMEKRPRPLHFLFDKWTISLCQKEICVSKSVEEFTREMANIPATKLQTIYNGISLKKLSPSGPKACLDIPKEKFILGTLGRLVPEKGLDVLIKAFSLVYSQSPKTSLVIVGSGPEERKLKKLSHSLGINHAVIWIPYSDEVALYYRSFDLFIAASIFEGFGLTVVEAMASGCPVVVSDIPPFRELLPKDMPHLLVPPASPQLLAEKILTLATDKQLLKNIAQRGLKQAQKFSQEQMIQNYKNLYINSPL